MDSRRWLESLREEFARRKLPQPCAERMMAELTDHYHSFMEDCMRKDVANSDGLEEGSEERECLERALGSPVVIGKLAVEQYRRQRFAGRHPLFVFAVLPIISLPLLSLSLMIAVGLLLSVLAGDSAVPDVGPEPAWIYPVARAVICGFVILPAIGLAALLCRAARRAALDWKWPLVACLLLALLGGSAFSITRPKTADKPGLLILGVGTPSSTTIGFQLAQLLAPLAVGGSILCRRQPQPRWG
jgi:hypothetical protein